MEKYKIKEKEVYLEFGLLTYCSYTNLIIWTFDFNFIKQLCQTLHLDFSKSNIFKHDLFIIHGNESLFNFIKNEIKSNISIKEFCDLFFWVGERYSKHFLSSEFKKLYNYIYKKEGKI